MFTAILGLASLGLGIAGSIMSGKAADEAAEHVKKQQKEVERNKGEQQAWFNKLYYQDVTNRTDVQQMLNKINEQQRTAGKQQLALNTAIGATDEAKVASQDSLNKSYAGLMGQLAINAQTRRDALANDWRNRLDNYSQQTNDMYGKIADIYTGKSDAWAQTASNAYSTAFNQIGSDLDSMTENAKWQKWV